MKIFKSEDNKILVNRETGGAGNTIYAPDTVDDFVWVSVDKDNYDKWHDKDNQNLINEEIKNYLTTIPSVLVDNKTIDIANLNIEFSDKVYSFENLMNDAGITLFKNVDLIDKDYLLNESNNDSDNNVEDATIIED